MFPSYRNQSVDLLCKSTDWFLYIMGTLVVKKLILNYVKAYSELFRNARLYKMETSLEENVFVEFVKPRRFFPGVTLVHNVSKY